ncbi:MAG: SirB2 family protein [Candidatus Accumulibacter sp.]|uniref:SirB2 family protein n=1 Tax=Accumulibacter sp. TaxID=2053492 RepID=UPI0028786C18|nr:SirB2 family protein [Accumulibacter sp.]MDS4013279.1 SirB2 family protein [Accumulibacter sp.]
MSYLLFKQLHVSCVILSAAGFLLRGFWMLFESPLLQTRAARVVPHIVDTVLLASAIAMLLISAQWPWHSHWLSAKLVGLLVYIGCGSMALKRARTRRQRAAFLLAALCALAYIVSVALTRSPLGALAWLA